MFVYSSTLQKVYQTGYPSDIQYIKPDKRQHVTVQGCYRDHKPKGF